MNLGIYETIIAMKKASQDKDKSTSDSTAKKLDNIERNSQCTSRQANMVVHA